MRKWSNNIMTKQREKVRVEKIEVLSDKVEKESGESRVRILRVKKVERTSNVQKLREKIVRTLIEKVQRENNEKSGGVERKVERECKEAVYRDS